MRARSCSVAAGLALFLNSAAFCQPVFSVDFQGPTTGQADFSFAVAITEGDILVASPGGVPLPGPLPLPGIAIFAGLTAPPRPNLGVSSYGQPPGPGHPPGVAGFVEVDALSFGTDFLLTPAPPFTGVWTFSVDEYAVGVVVGSPSHSTLSSEGASGAMQASADVFGAYPTSAMPPGPLAPGAVSGRGNAVLFDGDGVSPASAHPAFTDALGLGLREPNAPGVLVLPDPGDNLDALDVDTGGGMASFPIYFSLDCVYADPLENAPSGFGPVLSSSAAANGFVGGDVLVTTVSGGSPVVYAPASMLGLDYLMGPDSDDLDALVLLENGVPGYQPAAEVYDWGPGGGDMLLFSVRRASAIIGATDSLLQVPIEEGDILVPPPGGKPAFPGIFIAAENLGLATFRTDGAVPGDDLDALDVSADCNANGVPDILDIVLGLAVDCNEDRIPDTCQSAAPEANCTDGIDNDCDGLTDCLDPQCACGCATDVECALANDDACTCDECFGGTCASTPIVFGNVNCIGPIDLDDILCVLDGFADLDDCPNGDTAPPCSGNNLIDLDDILVVIDAFAGDDPCACP